MNSNPITPSFKTGEFWFAGLSASAIVAIAATFNLAVDQQVIDVISSLVLKGVDGVIAIVALATLAKTVFTKRTDLKATMIQQGLIPASPVVTPVVTPVVEPVTPPSETAPVA